MVIPFRMELSYACFLPDEGFFMATLKSPIPYMSVISMTLSKAYKAKATAGLIEVAFGNVVDGKRVFECKIQLNAKAGKSLLVG